jgi:hypothetical protein
VASKLACHGAGCLEVPAGGAKLPVHPHGGVCRQDHQPRLTAQIHSQIEKDLYLRDTVKGYEPRWMFLEAPPSQELSRMLELNKIDVLTHN